MSMAVNNLATTQPAPRGVEWLDLSTAATRSGKSLGHLRRLCGEKWLAQGLAKMDKIDGRPTWFIRSDADPSLARVAPRDVDGSMLRELSTAKRKVAMDRLAILNRFNTALKAGYDAGKGKGEILDQFLLELRRDENLMISPRTLYGWEKQFNTDGLAGLVDSRGLKAAEQIDTPFLQELRNQYLNQRKRSKQLCYEIASTIGAEKEWEIPAYRTACRHLDQIPQAVVMQLRFGAEAFTNEAEPYIERDYTTLSSNEQWVGDHHQFDVFVKFEGKLIRPWLTAWMDMRSRLLVGWTISAGGGNTDTILAAIRDGIKEYGVPAQAIMDNGKDYDSAVLQGRTKKDRQSRLRLDVDADRMTGVFNQLSIQPRHCPPHHPQSKTIERFFGTVCSRFSVLFDTYCGNKTENKPEDLPDQLAADKAPEFSEFVELFGQFIAGDYHVRPHRGDGMDGRPPLEVFEACLIQKRTAPQELLDIICQQLTKPITVTRVGVTWKGLHYGKLEPKIMAHLGQKLRLRIDDRDLSKLTAWTLDDQFIAVAHANLKVPANADAEQLRQAITEKKKLSRLHKQFHDSRPHMHEDVLDIMRRRAGRRLQKAAGNDLPPPSLKPVQTPLNGQMDMLQKALNQPMRIAAGAESLRLEDVANTCRVDSSEDHRINIFELSRGAT